jgi:L-2,4-diaminobutyrate decarboxylase
LKPDELFLGGKEASLGAYRAAMEAATAVVSQYVIGRDRPFHGGTPLDVTRALADLDLVPEAGRSAEESLRSLGELVVKRSVVAANPYCVAHLHCPPLIPSLAAEVVLTAVNASMDSWDQSGAATLVEQRVISWLCGLFGYSAAADGTFTSGGTQSNLMGLLLARDAYACKRLGWSIRSNGLPPEAPRFRILTSECAHFSVTQAAMILGMGAQAVVPVAADSEGRMAVPALERMLSSLRTEGLLPIAVVTTAGTTDFGAIDPLAAVAVCAREQDLWLHVDAAYGGALALSKKHRDGLRGIESADSITVDFHKLCYQPISCGAFLVKEAAHFDLMRVHADYLNPESDEAMGYPNLVTKSIQTTRRFDALKVVATLQSVGRAGLAALIEESIDLAVSVAGLIETDPVLELKNRPTINAVVFRYRPADRVSDDLLDRVNMQIRLALLERGNAVVACTRVSGRTCLKFTLLNPLTKIEHVREILERIKELGLALWHEADSEHFYGRPKAKSGSATESVPSTS